MSTNRTVIKRDGSREAFDPEKVARVVMAAGLSRTQADQLAQRLTTWVVKQKTDEVSSLQLRDRVQLELNRISKNASGLFTWYQKTKELTPNE